MTQQTIDIVWEFLRNNRLVTVATLSAEKKTPEASLVYYSFENLPYIYISTYKDSRKLKNIVANDTVALVISDEAKATVLQIEGTAKVLQDSNVKMEVIEKISKVANQNPQSSFFPPILSLSANSQMEFVEIKINWFKYSVFDTHFPSIIEGTPENWQERALL